MARDYYPPIARAVAGLKNNPPAARQEVYARGRIAPREQVRDFEPALNASERTNELLALEQAMLKWNWKLPRI